MPEAGTVKLTFMNDDRRKVRQLIGLTLDELAVLTDISKSALSKWETGVEPLAAERQLLVDRVLRTELGKHALQVADLLEQIEKSA